MCQSCEPLLKAIDAYIEKANDDLSGTLKDAGFEKAKDTVKEINAIEDEVAEALTDETSYFVDNLSDSDSLEDFASDVWQKVKKNDKLGVTASKIFQEEFSTFMPSVIETYLKKTDKSLQLYATSKRTTAWIKSWSEELGKIMQLNSHTEIENLLITGLENGSSIADFTQTILDSKIRDEYYKARRVAVTEVLRAHSVAQQEAFMQSPAVSEKMWKHTGGHKNAPRENHVAMDGQRVPIDEPFELVGADGVIYHCMYPRDSTLPPEESINCHCISQPVVSKEVLGMSLEERQRLQQEAIDEMDSDWEKELDAQNRARAGIEEDP
ncbi:MAG: phage head morphogenesis protein [Ruminococcus sp.]|nr:phage head morphogenesis protein [Ruminococcus sp.]